MRSELIEELIKEVYGPRNGSEEEIEANPAKEYITGVIVPQACRKGVETPDSEMISEGGENMREDDDEEEMIFTSTPSELDPKMRPKSFGISFVVRGDTPSFKVCITWGRYSTSDRKTWKRVPYHAIQTIDLQSETDKFFIYEGEDGKISLYMRKIPQDDGNTTVVLNLVNDLKITDERCFDREIADSSIFQPSIRIKLNRGTELSSFSAGNKQTVFDFLYRKKPVLARGFMCSAIWRDIDYFDRFNATVLWADGYHFECSEFYSPDIRSEFVPLYSTSAPVFHWNEEIYGKEPELSLLRLSEMWDEDTIETYLRPLTAAYEKWIEENRKEMGGLKADEKKMASYLIERQMMFLDRIQRGIELLKKDSRARLSFCFANRAVWQQRKWQTGEKDFSWRPFQLAFILMSIESVYDDSSEYRDYADLLWIPTGGGKTEAYLAVMAFAMSSRRLKARGNDSSDGSDVTGGGTAVLTRYTLRLLTIQQFRRTLRMVTAAEYLRVMKTGSRVGWRPVDSDYEGDWIYGSTRFSAGMWVGSGVSPNHLRKEKGAIGALSKQDADGEPAQVIRCPVCNSWLAIPDAGLPAGKNTLHLVIKSTRKPEEIQKDVLSHKKHYIKGVAVCDEGHPSGFMTLTLKLDCEKKLTADDIEDMWKQMAIADSEVASFRASRPGYFGIGKELGRIKKIPADFEIYCPNPSCHLNQDVSHIEGVPLSPDSEGDNKLPDGLVIRKEETPFLLHSRIPIPAYTVDEQIYHRCPTVIVSTADKIARLAFEPRASSIFGNVTEYNAFYGYYRDDLLPEETTANSRKVKRDINPFRPPDLVVQDELHLVNGPLGSMFGLYELVVDGLIKTAGGRPKYIASTATIKEADSQVKRLFAREVFQFPPHGMSIDNSFFVKEPASNDSWNENKSGRIYMGIYSPAMGPLTPTIRIWSRLLKTSFDLQNDYPAEIKYFWTIVGYFNAIRELGGGRALYREDIMERIEDISDRPPRPLEPDRVMELSSRVNSTDIPQMLEYLEAAGNRPIEENPDAIFTTSMFGTGVDIPHLSLMVVNGQPKTTSQYIQATGRVGRSRGGLVVTFLRAGRPRDLSHYEMFPAYHQRIHLDVEPSSVSPFSDGCLIRAAGPAMVSFLRNMPEASVSWYDKNSGTVINDMGAENDIDTFRNEALIPRLKFVLEKQSGEKIKDFEGLVDLWKNIASSVKELSFSESNPFRPPEKDVVLGDPQHEKSGRKVVYKNAPQSLREIEETTGFEV